MATKTINVEMLAKMFLAGAGNIEAKKEFINELNVFRYRMGIQERTCRLRSWQRQKKFRHWKNLI